MNSRYSKRYRQTFPSDNAHNSLLETFQAIGYLPSLAGSKRTNSSTFRISLEEEIPIKTEGVNGKKSNQEEKGHRKDNCEGRVEPQETPLLLSITENLENATVDQPADDSNYHS